MVRTGRDQLAVLLAMKLPGAIAPADLRAKLEPPEMLGELLTYQPLEPLPGLHAVLAAQREGCTMQMGNLDLVDGDRDEAYAQAIENLAGLPLPKHSRRRLDTRLAESWVDYLDADDSFGASRFLVLPELMRRVLGRAFPTQGVLVAVPTKFELWVHVPETESALDTGMLMAHGAWTAWAEQPFPLSPNVFWVSPDMHAVDLIRPDRTGAFVDQYAMVDLLDTLATHRRMGEAS